ncbi:hypothetical protein BN946_scf185043.g243 [Trametes cinnabarina]|uniref:TFIIS N-terminal domain-containing protein n=1 Tax=Pycnoporus cinnabarinus TaxID=5643 RepID=A0A060SJ26_PYCCI|nr:hypothetical protein BN946_scf185043.g243 [Trametes cinnabarina]
MDFNSAAWLQTQQIPDLQTVSVHDERSAAGSNDWKDSAASMQNGGGLNDFLGDMQAQADDDAHSVFATVQHTSTPPISQSTNGFSIPLPSLLLSTSPSYNAASYANQWMSNSQPQLPLSSYSSLNGATSTSSHLHSQSQGQGQGQTESQGSGHMVIDPALTTMNGSSASPPPQYQQPQYLSASTQARMQFQYQQPAHQAMLSINPSFMHTSISQFQQQQAQQTHQHPFHHFVRQSHSPPQQQGTLSPYALHSPAPTGSLYTAISPPSFYGQSSQPPQSSQSSQSVAGPSSASPSASSSAPQSAPTTPPAAASTKVSTEQARARLAADVRPYIQPNSFTGGGAVSQLVNILDEAGFANVDAKLRLDIVTKIRDCAGNHYFRAWVDNPVAMEVVREWLKLAFIGRHDPQLVETIMPILHIIDRLPLTLDKLKQYKLGKLIMKLMKEPPTPGEFEISYATRALHLPQERYECCSSDPIKDMASNLEQKWRKMLNAQETPDSKAESEKAEDTKGKKRRAEPASSKAAPPAKKVAVPAAGSSKAKAPKTTKAQMPSFKKNTSAPSASMSTAPTKKEPDANVAQPSHTNHFQEILKALAPTSAGPSNSTPPPALGGPPAGPSTASGSDTQPQGKSEGKRKKVTWAPDGQLEQIRLIERAVYDDDGATVSIFDLHHDTYCVLIISGFATVVQGSLPTHSIRDLDRSEGAALHNHLFEEQIEWTEPQPLEMPAELEIPERGNESEERVAQEEREQSALVVSYASPAQIPDSPAEPQTQIPDEKIDEGTRTMLCGPEVDAIFWNEGAPAPLIPMTSVAELVGQLAAPAPPASQPVSSLGIDPEQLQQLAQALSSQGNMFGVLGGPQAPPPQAPPPQVPPPHAPAGPSHGGNQGMGGDNIMSMTADTTERIQMVLSDEAAAASPVDGGMRTAAAGGDGPRGGAPGVAGGRGGPNNAGEGPGRRCRRRI